VFKPLEQINLEFLNESPLKEPAPQLDLAGKADQLIADIQSDLDAIEGITFHHQPQVYRPLAIPFTENPKREAKHQKKIITERRATDIILCVLIGFILISAVIFNVKSNNSYTIFGYSGFTMLGESMQSEIPKGALVITKKADINSVKIGDDITFTRNDGATVTHRVISIMENDRNSGFRGFETQGIENPAPDADIIHAENVVGVVKLSIPVLGSVLDYISGNIGIVLLILGGILVTLIVVNRNVWARNEDGKKQKHLHCAGE